jgi:phage protein D
MEKIIREPLYEVIWAEKNVTKDVSPYLIELRYTDNLHGKSDEIELVFEDRDSRWKSSWFPRTGDIIRVRIGLKDEVERWLNCGSFTIDEVEYHGPPDVISVKGQSTYATAPLREHKTTAWENTTLKQICVVIAKRNGLKPFLRIKPDLKFKRVDQKDQSDLAFLKSLCEKYGYNVKVEDEKLIVCKPEELEKANAVAIISRDSSDIISFRFSNKLHDTYKSCVVSYWDPKKKKMVTHVEKAKHKTASGNILKISERVENKEQAIARAKAELKNKNKWEWEGDLVLSGNPYLVAGANILLKGFGKFDGKYHIETANHILSKSLGYQTSIIIRRV